MRISITNNGNSRNRGCEALTRSLLLGLQSQRATNAATITIHSKDPDFDRWRFGDQSRCLFSPVGEWYVPHFRFLGLNRFLCKSILKTAPLLPKRFSNLYDFKTAAEADLIVSTGGDNFSMDYGSFYTHATYLNLGPPIFMCAQSIGPFAKREEEYFRKSCANVRLITVRESHSYAYLKGLGLNCPVEQTADVAFLLPTLSREETLAYARKFLNADLYGRKLVGLSISELITKYYKYGRDEGIKQIAAFIDAVNDMGYGVVLIPHVCERTFKNDDQVTCLDVLRQVKSVGANVAMNGWFSSIEVKSVIGLCDILIGARTHATIASLSQGIPTVAVAYSRKAYGIMEDYYGSELSKKLIVPADHVYAESLMDAMRAGIQIGRQNETADKMKRLALRNFELLSDVIADR